MAVNWLQNPYQQRGITPFVQPEEQYDTSGSSWMGGIGGQQAPQVDSIFAPANPGESVMGGAGMLGGDGGQPMPPGSDQGDYPTPESIARRRKLAEALMGQQMEVNHPMQAVANAVSKISGAWMDKRAEDEQKKYEQHRRDLFQKSFDQSGGDLDKMMSEWMKSGDPDLVERAYEYQMKKMMAEADGGKPPETRTFYEGNTVVTKQWDPSSRTWVPIGDPSPRWKGGSTGGGGGGGYYGDETGAGAPSGQPGDPSALPPGATPPSGKTPQTPSSGVDAPLPGPGPRGKRSLQKGQNMQLQDGTVIATVYNPNDGNTYYKAKDGWHAVPYDARPSSVTTGGKLTPEQWVKLRQDWQNERNGLDALTRYFKTVKDLPTGINRWALDVSAKFKTFIWNGQPLTRDQFNKMDASAQAQALLGLFRTTIVGPGVMTEYDAQRVLQALGGDPGSALQNPQVMAQVLSTLYERKYKQYKILDEEIKRNASTYGYDPSSDAPIPPTLDGGAPGGQGGGPSASAPALAPSRPKLKPPSQRTKGETVTHNGKTYVWNGSGWVPR